MKHGFLKGEMIFKRKQDFFLKRGDDTETNLSI